MTKITKQQQLGITVLLAVFTLLFGMFLFNYLEGWSFVDSLYFSLITLTTIGYGDLSPTTDVSKIATMIYAVLGLGILMSFIDGISRWRVERRALRRAKKETVKNTGLIKSSTQKVSEKSETD